MIGEKGAIIDALEKTPEAGIDTRRIAVTGCSRADRIGLKEN